MSRYEWTIQLIVFTSDWSLTLASSVNNTNMTKGDFHYILVLKKCVIGVVFHRWVMYCLHHLGCQNCKKLEKGSILQVHNGVHPIMEVAPPIKA